jgi:uncharacterized membrane protein YjjB (DUF3815 family)
MKPTPHPKADLHQVRQSIESGQIHLAEPLERALQACEQSACRHAYVLGAQAQLRQAIDDAGRQGPPDGSPLAGLPVSVKDLFDVAGQPTRAGSVVLQGPAATQDCPAVARVRAAGGLIAGRTNMTEFAFSGVGINPHHGTPINPADSRTPRIPGGSSSGAAVSVALLAQKAADTVMSSSHAGFVGAFVAVPFALLASRVKTSPPGIVMLLAAFWSLVPGALSFMAVGGAAAGDQAVGITSLAATGAAILSIALGTLVGWSIFYTIDSRLPWSQSFAEQP